LKIHLTQFLLKCIKLKKNTGWKAQYDDLEFIIKTAWEWEKKR